MPTINAEVTYEGILDTCFERVVRFAAWSCLLSGAAGHTYGANGIWQVNRRDEPYGKSPHGGNWGNRPWDDAMRLPGSKQVSLAKRLLERYAWQKFEPHPEWVAMPSERNEIQWGDWIWFPKGDPTFDAAVGPCYFRKTFDIHSPTDIAKAVLRVAADDRCTAYVNGKTVGACAGWQHHHDIDVRSALQSGKNVLAVRAENGAAPVPNNPAGLLCSLELIDTAEHQTFVLSDATWRSSMEKTPGWDKPAFNDDQWPHAKSAAKYGGGPWGKIAADDDLSKPFCAGIAKQVRVIYLPESYRVTVRAIEPDTHYSAAFFNPVDLKQTPAGAVQADQHGEWIAPKPPSGSQDWVLVVQHEH